MHIGMLVWNLLTGKGGVPSFSRRFARALLSRGHEVSIFYRIPEQTESLVDLELPERVRLIGLDLSRYRPGAPDLEKRLQKCRELFLSSGIDVFLSLLSMPELVLFPSLLVDTGIPWILSHRGEPSRINKQLWNAYENHACLLAADALHVQLPEYIKEFPDFLRDKAVAIPNAVDGVSLTFPLPQEKKKNKIILAAGRFAGVKQYHLLIEAFASVSQQFPAWKLVLCGEGLAQKRYEQLISSLHMSNKILLPGFLTAEEMGHQYRSAHIFCHPSFSEGFPNAVIEAQSYGLPVIAFARCSGVNQIVIHNENGILAEEMTAKCLADHLAPVMASAETRLRLGKTGWKMLSRYAPEKVFPEWEALFQNSFQHKGNTQLQRIYRPMTEQDVTVSALQEILHRETPMAGYNFVEVNKMRRQLVDRAAAAKAQSAPVSPDKQTKDDALPASTSPEVALSPPGKSEAFADDLERAFDKRRKGNASNLTIATIITSQLFEEMLWECDLIPISPHNWRITLSYLKPDFILVESFIRDASIEDWNFSQIPSSAKHAELLSILLYAAERGIPTVFWMTLDSEYHSTFSTIISRFMYVFCADPDEIIELSKEGINAVELLPCVQPSLFTPLHNKYADEDGSLTILNAFPEAFSQSPQGNEIITQLHKSGLHLEPKERSLYTDDMYFSEIHAMKKCVSPRKQICLTTATQFCSKTRVQWLAMRLAAGLAPLAFLGCVDNLDILRAICLQYESADSVMLEAMRFDEDNLYFERKSHLLWRAVYQKHTLEQRIESICNNLHIHCEYSLTHCVTLVSIVKSQYALEKLLTALTGQSYPEKEYVVACVGFTPVIAHSELTKRLELMAFPAEMGVTDALTAALQKAQGEYVVIFPPGGYGKNFVNDMFLFNKSARSSIFCKIPRRFEKEAFLPRQGGSAEPHMTFLSCNEAGLLSKSNLLALGGKRELVTELYLDKYQFSARGKKAEEHDFCRLLGQAGEAGIPVFDGFNYVVTDEYIQNSIVELLDEHSYAHDYIL